jgi:broad specificity phosphatase PhoE
VSSARILLVRHGESTWNASARWQGRADPPLTDTGQRQAAAAAEALGAVDAIVASTLQRAHHTAVILSELLGVGPVHLDERLVERDAGEWTGLTMAEIDERYPGARQEWRTPPGFETDDALLERLVPVLTELGEVFPGGSVVAVTHGGVIFALARHLAGTAARIPNLGAQWVDVGPDGHLALGERVPLLAEHEPARKASDVTEQV